MYYSELVKTACQIVMRAHGTDTDKGGYPYVMHPFYLAQQLDDEASVCTALLHDVIEDHGDEYDFESLAALGFYPQIIDALKLLTHAEGVPYMDYVRAIGTNDIARRVKIEDLKHNMDTRRVGGVRTKKYDTYCKALQYLTGLKADG